MIIHSNTSLCSPLGLRPRLSNASRFAPRRSAIASDLKKRKGLEYADNEILVSNGAKQSVYQGILAFCGPGDEVLIPAPFWPSYPEMVALTGAKPVIVPTTIEDGFLVDPVKLEGYINENTKLMIFCNPSNPTGAVHSGALQEEIALVMKKVILILVANSCRQFVSPIRVANSCR